MTTAINPGIFPPLLDMRGRSQIIPSAHPQLSMNYSGILSVPKGVYDPNGDMSKITQNKRMGKDFTQLKNRRCGVNSDEFTAGFSTTWYALDRESDSEHRFMVSLNGYIKKCQNAEKMRQGSPMNTWLVRALDRDLGITVQQHYLSKHFSTFHCLH